MEVGSHSDGLVVSVWRTSNEKNVIWVNVDRLTKSTHFLSITNMDPLETLTQLYVKKIVRLHVVPKTIVSGQDQRFTFHFLKKFTSCNGTRLKFSRVNHQQPDNQFEWTIQTMESMLRVCALEFRGSWDNYLPLIEFTYNNSYQATIPMVPYKALHGRKCRSPLHWDEVKESKLIGS